MTSFQGNPCWYELGTTDLDGAQRFYAGALDWQIARAPMEGFDYRLASAGGDMVAGMMSTEGQAGAPPTNWLIYFATDDCDATAAAITAAGGSILKPPADIPGTGRFAVATDPQGAVFGILQPDMSRMSPEDRAKAEAGGGAFDQSKAGHGNWNELMSTDPAAAFDFYSGLFGWTKSQAMDMGAMGTYQLIAHKGRDIGAMMGLGSAPMPTWLPYFGANGIDAAISRITDGGGKLHRGPIEVPGGAYIAVATDPQGGWFAVVGPRDVTK
ncbi:VOC family protein [Paracoccus suum]|uniref:VOC family protein n=1 Tax=Paracoccus suum TaxID=2259340 RepID=A0A344PH86_9RHOB|nr:VOC family protein [Paracoccus suum]AXC48741.1 VOC family protein [Paracoccus suum]